MNYFQTIEQIICFGEGFLPKEVKTKTRKREIVFARQAIMYFMKKYTKDSLATIGGHFGKDHATVLHACKTISNLMDSDKRINYKILAYDSKIKEREQFEMNILTDDVVKLKDQLIQSLIVNKTIDHSSIEMYNKLLLLLEINKEENNKTEPTEEELKKAIEVAIEAIKCQLNGIQKIDLTAILSYNQLLYKAGFIPPE
jgi:hypothetical protein